jgi:hypothetical protein
VDAMTPRGIFPPRVHGQSVAAMVEAVGMVNGLSRRHHRKGGIGPSNPSMEFRRAVTLNGF